MAAIDIGNIAKNRASAWSSNYTTINLGNPANETGTITSVEVWANNNTLTGTKIGIFYLVSGTTYGVRSVASVGTIDPGSKVTFNVSLSVEAGDFIGIYFAGVGSLEATPSGGSGVMYASGDKTGGSNSYTSQSGFELSLFGSGSSPVTGPANLKTYNTNLVANIKTINTNPIANIKSLNTNT